MTAEPSTLLAVKAWLHIGILAVGQRTYKQKNLEDFASGSVYQLHDFSAPANLAGIPRTMSKMIRQVVTQLSQHKFGNNPLIYLLWLAIQLLTLLFIVSVSSVP
jgi:hypothetical protein